jgi:hypothetical protein
MKTRRPPAHWLLRESEVSICGMDSLCDDLCHTTHVMNKHSF